MAEVTDITSIPLYQILGAPLLALVQAEVQAAQATMEFIEKVGFGFDPSQASSDLPNHYGELRTVTFRYTKIGVGGKEIDFIVSVPILSLVPIPAMQISDARIDFAVEINDAVKIDTKTTLSVPEEKDQDNSIESDQVMFKAGLASRDSKTAMHVTINVKQADTPIGMQALFRVMDQGISSVSQDDQGEGKKEEEEKKPSPKRTR